MNKSKVMYIVLLGMYLRVPLYKYKPCSTYGVPLYKYKFCSTYVYLCTSISSIVPTGTSIQV